MKKIERNTAAELVAQELANTIISGRLKPGDRLKEQEVCAELQTSRVPVREAFRILQSRGLVEYLPYHGVRVKLVTRKEIEDQYDIQSVLEVHAVGLAAAKMTPKDAAYLEGLVDGILSLKRTDIMAFRDLDDKFHLHLCNLSGNNLVGPLIRSTFDSTLLMRNSSVCGSRTITDAGLEHRAILEALVNGDGPLAQEKMRYHHECGLRGALEAYQNFLAQNPELVA